MSGSGLTHCEPMNRMFERAGASELDIFRRTGEITPGSLLGKALAYAAGQWPHLEPCFIDGQIEFDNNLIYAARGISEVMPPLDLCRVAA